MPHRDQSELLCYKKCRHSETFVTKVLLDGAEDGRHTSKSIFFLSFTVFSKNKTIWPQGQILMLIPPVLLIFHKNSQIRHLKMNNLLLCSQGFATGTDRHVKKRQLLQVTGRGQIKGQARRSGVISRQFLLSLSQNIRPF